MFTQLPKHLTKISTIRPVIDLIKFQSKHNTRTGSSSLNHQFSTPIIFQTNTSNNIINLLKHGISRSKHLYHTGNIRSTPPTTNTFLNKNTKSVKTLTKPIPHHSTHYSQNRTFTNHSCQKLYTSLTPSRLLFNQKRTFFDRIKFHFKNNRNRGYTRSYSYHTYPGQRWRLGYEWSRRSNPVQRESDNLIINSLAIIIMIFTCCVGLELTNLHDKTRFTWLSNLRSFFFGIVYRDDIASLRLLNTALTSSPYTLTSSKSTHSSIFQRQLNEVHPHAKFSLSKAGSGIVRPLKSYFIVSTATHIELDFPIDTTTASSRDHHGHDRRDHNINAKTAQNFDFEQEHDSLFNQFYNAHHLASQHTAFTATSLYDSYQLLKELHNNIEVLESLTIIQKVKSLWYWYQLTRIRNFLGKELIKQHNSLVDVTKAQKHLALNQCHYHDSVCNTSNIQYPTTINCNNDQVGAHLNAVGSHKDTITEENQNINNISSSTSPPPHSSPSTSTPLTLQYPFGTHFQTTLMDQVLHARALALMTDEFLRVSYHWGLFQSNYNDPRFLLKYSTTFFNNDDNHHIYDTNNIGFNIGKKLINTIFNSLPQTVSNQVMKWFPSLNTQSPSDGSLHNNINMINHHNIIDNNDNKNNKNDESFGQFQKQKQQQNDEYISKYWDAYNQNGNGKIEYPISNPLPWTLKEFKHLYNECFTSLKQHEMERYKQIVIMATDYSKNNHSNDDKNINNNNNSHNNSTTAVTPSFSYKYQPNPPLQHHKLHISPFKNDSFINIGLLRQYMFEDYLKATRVDDEDNNDTKEKNVNNKNSEDTNDNISVSVQGNSDNITINAKDHHVDGDDDEHEQYQQQQNVEPVVLSGTNTASVLLRQQQYAPTFKFPYDANKRLC